MDSAAVSLEKRGATLEVRARGRRLEGYAALFGAEARIGSFEETIRAGAFAATIASGADVLALVDHDAARLLARTKSGTLRLAEDTRGLHFEIDAPDTSLGRDIVALAERGDLGGMSFGFSATDEHWNGNRRELRAVDLKEISIVLSWPAYQGTTIAARSRAAAAPSIAARYVDILRRA